MPRTWWYRVIFLIFTLLIAVVHVIPSVFPNMDTKRLPVKQKINLGLDLQGGLYLIMGVQFPQVFKESLMRNAKTIEGDSKKNGIPIKSITFKEASDPNDPLVIVDIEDAAKVEDFRTHIRKDWGSVLRVAEHDGNKIAIGFTSQQIGYISEKTVSQSIEVIRNRIDEFGVSEPMITSHGKDKILLELPGVRDIERAKSLIGQTAKLEFRIVEDQKMSGKQLQALIDKTVEANKDKYSDDLKLSEFVRRLNDAVEKELPENTMIAYERIKDPVKNTFVAKVPYLISKQVDVTGDDLQDAFVSVDPQDNMPFVSLNFNYRGATKFEQVTGANVKRRLAIVLDGVVHSAPVLNEKIGGGKARITMGRGNYESVLKESTDLAIVLRAGALPAQLEFQEQRVVGPSLGADSIAAGAKASWIAFILIMAFMAIYYRGSGMIANFGVAMHALFTFAFLVGLDATLTLPGIAGIALTLGMAVDANVLIYERIREELRHGKSVQAALQLGFERASSTILDSNLTVVLAALVLVEFGTGPVRGFAVTLLAGIATSIYTAVFASRIIFEWWILRPGKHAKTISI